MSKVEYIEEYQLLVEGCRSFLVNNVSPFVTKWDRNEEFPKEVYDGLGELGVLGLLLPEKYGGINLNYHAYSAILIEISKVCGSLGLSVAAHNSLCSQHIFQFGNELQKDKYLPDLAQGKSLGAWALTEPNSGSDSKSMSCTAVKEGNYWIVNGSKIFITHGASAEVCVLLARTGNSNLSTDISAFIVDKGTEGFTVGKPLKKLGMKACETVELFFQDCKIPATNLIGNVGHGFKQAMHILEGGRISIASLALGISIGAFEIAMQYSKERKQFSKSISEFQAVSFMLADMATQIEACRLLIKEACNRKEHGEEIGQQSAMAKLFASEVAVAISNNAVQILGGYGYMTDYLVEKFYRDAKLCTIGEGTSEIQRMIIAKNILQG